MKNIFESVPNWCFTKNDQQAQRKLSQLRIQACSVLPAQSKSNKILLLFDQMRDTRLYPSLKTLPKGCMHHLHIDCCEDEQFYALHVVTDPNVYLGPNMNCFYVGTRQQASQKGWKSMQEARKKFNSQNAFIKHVSNITMLNKNQIIASLSSSQSQSWDRFQAKISNFFPIYYALHIFKKYLQHVFRKFIKNGYDRIQFRALLVKLTQYSNKGEIVKQHSEKKFIEAFDQVYQKVKKQNPAFTTGVVFFGLKFLKPQQNIKIFSTVLQQNWSKTIGLDFVQQQDPNGSQQPYDDIMNQILSKYPNQNIKKVYHAGQTKDHLNNNVQIAIKAGSARIGHGINVLQHPELIQLCRQKQICFEKNPISNLMFSYTKDPRISSFQILLGLGIPISINPDDPGKFGLEDCTMDYFVAFISSNWTLKHLKLIGYHSINHAICSQETRKQLVKSYNSRWDDWVNNFIAN